MPKQIIIAEQHRIAAVFSEDQIQELIVATGSHQVGDIYLGVVENVLPAIDAAFVNLGDTEKNGFIHVSDLGPVKLKRSAGAITELLSPQQKVLIQVMKEPTGNKGPRLTGNISMPGRYLVLMPFGRGVNLSRRIRNENERNRLRALGILIKPAGMGLLLRTEAEGVSEDLIMEDLDSLQKQWESVQLQANSTRAPALLGRDEDFIQRVLRDVYSADVNRIVVDSSLGLKRVKQQLVNWNSGKLPVGVLVDHHIETTPILEYFRINAAIREALKPRVDLPSGGYIVIERTEALTVVDVNSGSFTRSATARETVLWTNCEAATEIARQLRLRNIAGVIIIDFIDMDARRDQLQVLEQFNKAIKADKARPQIAQLSELGLVELTRKRQGQNIYELFGRSCPTCGGLGHLVHLPGESSVTESVERTTAARADYNYTSSSNRNRLPDIASEPREEFASFGEEPAEDTPLMHHPSYQERGNRRRGGRQQRSREPMGKTNPRIVTLPPTPGFVANGITPTLAIEDALVQPKPPTPEPLQERHRSSGRRQLPLRERQEPAEVITVTMTAEEQSVYAFMGISPLVLYSGEVKHPRSALVSVALPGGEPLPLPPTVSRHSSREEFTEEGNGSESMSAGMGSDIAVADPVTSISNLNVESPLEPTTKQRRVITLGSAAATPPVEESASDSSENLGESIGMPEPQPTLLSLTAVPASDSGEDLADQARRRRRRSSAAGEQLSLDT